MKRKVGRPKTKKKIIRTKGFPCQYCQRIIGNKGALKSHEKKCPKKPNQIKKSEDMQSKIRQDISEPTSDIKEIEFSVSEPVEENIPEKLTVPDEDEAAEEAAEKLSEKEIEKAIEEEEQNITEETVQQGLDIFFKGISAWRKEPVWELTKAENQSISPLATKMINKYLPNLKLGDEAVLALTAGMIIMGKLAADKNKKKKEEAVVEETIAEPVAEIATFDAKAYNEKKGGQY